MTAQPQQEKTYLTTKDLYERWGKQVQERTIVNWRSTGSGPPFTKIGGAVLYKLDELEKWETERTVTCTSDYKRQ